MKRLILFIGLISLSIIGFTQKPLKAPNGVQSGATTLNATDFINIDGTKSNIQDQADSIKTALALKLDADAVDTLSVYSDAEVDSIVATKYIQFLVNITSGAPVTGDSIYISSEFLGKNVRLYRDGVLQYAKTTASDAINGVYVNDIVGYIVVKPAFTASEKVILEIRAKQIYEAPAITQNLFKYSEELDNAVWYKGNVVITANQEVDLTGQITLDLVTFSNQGEEFSYSNSTNRLTVVPLTTYRVSWDAKKGTALSAKYSIYDNTNIAYITTETSWFSQIPDSGVGRISVSFTAPAGCTLVNIRPLHNSIAVTNSTIFLGRMQVDSINSDYVKTVSTAKP